MARRILAASSLLGFLILAVYKLPLLEPGRLYAAPPAGCTDCAEKGFWDAPYEWPESGSGVIAIHLALLRGENDETQVMYWSDWDKTWLWLPEGMETLTSSSEMEAIPVPVPAGSTATRTFCSGHSFINGQLAVVGGTEKSRGPAHVNLYDPGSKEWMTPRPADMQFGRYYPTVTTLSSGDDVFVTTGGRWREFVGFGGFDGTDVSGDLHGVQGIRDWTRESNVHYSPGIEFPPDRMGHSMVVGSGGWIYTFGGTSSPAYSDVLGGSTPDLWEAHHNLQKELWNWYEVTSNADPVYGFPAERSRHTATYVSLESPSPADTDDFMLVFGGRDADGDALGDCWKFYLTRNANDAKFRDWEKLQTQGSPPPARYGHSAALDPLDGAIVVFGGIDSSGASPTYFADTWKLYLYDDPPRWQQVSTSGSPTTEDVPLGREGHVGIIDANSAGGEAPVLTRLVIFGGVSDDSLFNDAWELDLQDSTWAKLDVADDEVAGEQPDARAWATAAYDSIWSRILIYGGDTNGYATGGQVSDVWGLPKSATPTWRKHHNSLLGGGISFPTAVFRNNELYATLPSIYDPDTTGRNGCNGRCDTLGTAKKWIRLYPHVFLLPSGKVALAGQIDSTFTLDPEASSPTWQFVDTSGFVGGTAVMYEPGKIMKCAFSGTEEDEPDSLTARIDLSTSDTGSWERLADMDTGRVDPNLTVLPDGMVLMTGGTRIFRAETTAVVNPQFWFPETGEWGDPDSLAPELTNRDYHSTALLLADARVISAGGFDKRKQPTTTASIFYPPYLFDSSGNLADRPLISGAPDTVSYDTTFTICVSDPETIDKVLLIRPGSVTHAFNMSQRYVPLAFEDPNVCGDFLIVRSPLNPNFAPPGDYMLFVVDEDGVPSEAKWVWVDSQYGLDTCDDAPPDAIADLNPFFVSQTAIYSTWTAPGDDDNCGQAAEYDLRYSTSSISDGNWPNYDRWTTDDPDTAGHGEGDSVSGLQSCTRYYFAIKTGDNAYNWSEISNLPDNKTLCGGGGPGPAPGKLGNDARNSDVVALGTDERESSPRAEASSQSSGSWAMVVETNRTDEGGWEVTIRQDPEARDWGDPEGAGVIAQERAGSAWRTLARFSPSEEEDRFGLVALRDGARLVFLGGFSLESVTAGLDGESGVSDLVSAFHSREGDVREELLQDVANIAMESRDALTLTYEGTEGSSTVDEWHLVIQRADRSSDVTQGLPRKPSDAIPETFALYQNEPNPVQGVTTVRFDLPIVTDVKLELYDVSGRRVRTLLDGQIAAGRHSAQWDLRDDAGRRLGAGVYLIKFTAGSFRSDQKVVVVR